MRIGRGGCHCVTSGKGLPKMTGQNPIIGGRNIEKESLVSGSHRKRIMNFHPNIRKTPEETRTNLMVQGLCYQKQKH